MLKDMTLTKEEASEEIGCSPCDPKYPWGLELTLNDDVLQKLGFKDAMPQVGKIMKIMAVATVTGVRSSQDQDGESESSMSLQITALDVEPASSDMAGKMWPDMEKAS